MTAILADGQAFALRVWTEDLGAEGIEWRAKVRHLPSGETRYFQEWGALLEFVRSKVEPTAWTAERDGALPEMVQLYGEMDSTSHSSIRRERRGMSPGKRTR